MELLHYGLLTLLHGDFTIVAVEEDMEVCFYGRDTVKSWVAASNV